MRKYLFLFHKTYAGLKKYPLHRLFVVVFFLTVTVIPIGSFFVDIETDSRSYQSCVDGYYMMYPFGTPNVTISLGEWCHELIPINFIHYHLIDTLAIFIGLFFGLQFLYFFVYKVFRYIKYGKS